MYAYVRLKNVSIKQYVHCHRIMTGKYLLPGPALRIIWLYHAWLAAKLKKGKNIKALRGFRV